MNKLRYNNKDICVLEKTYKNHLSSAKYVRVIVLRDLIKNIKQKKVILFVGSGVSATLGLPTWSEFISYIALNLDIEPELFKSYGDTLALTEYYKLEKGTIGSLRSWMDRNWSVSDEAIRQSEIFEMICKLEFPIIYTTNYDRCVEQAFSVFHYDFEKIVGVEDLAQSKHEKTQIIKFHGDFDYENTIVLTESSYFDRMNFESPLDIKLRADMLGKSILFIGYSLKDINIRYLIYKLNKLWLKSSNESKRPKSYIFLTTPNPVQERVLEERGVYLISGDSEKKSESLAHFLRELYDKTRE